MPPSFSINLRKARSPKLNDTSNLKGKTRVSNENPKMKNSKSSLAKVSKNQKLIHSFFID